MKAISFTFNNFDLVVDAFQSAGAYRIVRMLDDTILKKTNAFDKSFHRRTIEMLSHLTPIIKGLFNLLTVTVVVNKFKLIFQHIQNAKRHIQFENLLKSAFLFIVKVFSPLFGKQGWLSDYFIAGIAIFASAIVSWFVTMAYQNKPSGLRSDVTISKD